MLHHRIVTRLLSITLGGFFVTGLRRASANEDLRVGAAAANLEANNTMQIAGGLGPWLPDGQEGELRAVAVVLEKPGMSKVGLVACAVCLCCARHERVALGGYPPRAPTDPYVQNSRIQFLDYVFAARYFEWTANGLGSGKRSRIRSNQSQLGRRRLRRRSHLYQERVAK
jgi:hypothetical protein